MTTQMHDTVIPHDGDQQQWKPLTDAEMDAAIADARDALLDHVYEHGTVAEGTVRLARNIGRAVEHAHRNGSESK